MQISFYDGAIKGKREGQEDHKTNLKLSDGYYLYVLADGVGGHVGGKTASMAVCAAFRRYFDEHPAVTDPRAALLQALTQANAAIHDIIRENPHLEGMGSTVIALLLHEPTGKFSFVSVGDSPLYCMRQKMLIRLNANHAYYEELKKDVAAGKITMREANDHPDRHAISSAVMGNDIPLIDQREGTVLPGEYLMLASDGIQTLDDGVQGEIAQILISKKDPGEMVEALLKAVESKNDPCQDNTTLIVLCLETEMHPRPASSAAPEIPRIQTVRLTPLPQGLNVAKDRSQKRLYWIIVALCLIIAGLVVCVFWKSGGQKESNTAPSTHPELPVTPVEITPVPETTMPETDTSEINAPMDKTPAEKAPESENADPQPPPSDPAVQSDGQAPAISEHSVDPDKPDKVDKKTTRSPTTSKPNTKQKN